MEAKFNNISNIYSVFEILKDVKVDQTLNFKKSGIEIETIIILILQIKKI